MIGARVRLNANDYHVSPSTEWKYMNVSVCECMLERANERTNERTERSALNKIVYKLLCVLPQTEQTEVRWPSN